VPTLPLDTIYFSISAAAGLFVGAVVAGWLVRNRITHRYEQLLAAAHTEKSVLQEKLRTIRRRWSV